MRKHVSLLLAGFVLLVLQSAPTLANFCRGNYIDDVHRVEARELEKQNYSTGNNCASGSQDCWVGERDYNARIIACNRKRDVKPFKVGPINDLPMVHKAAGRLLDKREKSERNFAANLDPRMISGQIQYLGKFPKWYGYILERKKGNWIVTTVMDFKWPKAESKVVHLPIYLTTRLSTEVGGDPLTLSVCRGASSGKGKEGMIVLDDSNGTPYNRACRVQRHRQLFFIGGPSPQYIDTSLSRARARPVTEWIMRYWRGVIEDIWSRPNGSFQMRVLISDLAGQPGEMDEDDFDLYKKNDVVYELELHHNEARNTQMFRPIEVGGVKLYKAVYVGASPTTVAHEFGHSLGLGDEYALKAKPRTDRDCTALTGFVSSTAEHLGYAMCDDWDRVGSWLNPTRVGQQTVKSIYPWLITQRYSIGSEIRHCKEDKQCNSGEYCKKPVLGVNYCKSAKVVGDSCTSDKQCASPAVCKPKPFGKCVVEASRKIGEICISNAECTTGKCNASFCVCASDSNCPDGYCDKGTITIGANQCKSYKVNGEGCTRAAQCASGRCYVGACKPQDECSKDEECSGDKYCDKGTLSIGVNQCVALKGNGDACTRSSQCASNRCNLLGRCGDDIECNENRDCANNQYCDKGTLGVGKNQCKTKKPLGDSCSLGRQCASGCCKLHNLKVQCRPSKKCK